jgi:DNA-binding transcriptional MocR family regulator
MTAPDEGFSIIPNWLMRESDLTAHEILVYMALLNRAGGSGLAWPSHARIARESRTSVSTVKRTIKSLEVRGLIVKQVRKRADGANESNVYRVATFTRAAPKPAVQSGPGTSPDRAKPESSEDYEEDTLEEDTLEEDVRSTLPSGRDLSFIFVESTGKATKKQTEYLSDLHLHFNNAAPSVALQAKWRKLTSNRANDLIRQYLKEMPRYDAYEGPEAGDPEYEALSTKGQAFADATMLPDLVWEGATA